MDVATIEVSPSDAREKLRAYRSRRHKDAEAEYDAAIKIYEAAEDGYDIINVGDAICFGEFDDKGRPMLAIARADRKEVMFECGSYSRRFKFDARAETHHSLDRFPQLVRTFERPSVKIQSEHRLGYATVPMVPADVRPQKGQLKDWYILWEVEQWFDRRVHDPPYDPMLLEHIEGEFYKVLATWDLTELERAAMQLAFSQPNS